MAQPVRTLWLDLLGALLLAAGLATAWTLRDWSNLAALRLPDPDDAMRLQQIRDWLDGQAFADLTQYRLGPTGTVMHWSRLADLVPAGIIRALTLPLGRHQAEIAAVIAWPTMLLAAATALTGRIARALGGAEAARPAMIVAAIAYPATTLFMPGRIDHHGLQIVLMLAIVLAAVGRGSITAGLVIGIATSLSLVIGMETAPLLAVVAAILTIDWINGGDAARDRLMGYGVALAAVTIGASIIFRSNGWDYPSCDGFTSGVMRVTTIAGVVPIALVLAGRGISKRCRIALAGIGAATVAVAVLFADPACLDPYGGVAPLLRLWWLSSVGEAQPLLAAPVTVLLGYGGLLLAGITASIWQVWRTRARGWLVVLAVQLGSLAVSLAQVRGAYLGAELAAPALAAVIVAARRAGVVPLAAAWVASAGMMYPIAASALTRTRSAAPEASCTAPDLIEALRGLPAGVVLAPIDTGGYAIAATRQRMIAGAYHRDETGNIAMYRFYTATPILAHDFARRLGVTYVVACDGFAGVPRPLIRDPNRMAARLKIDRPPVWLRPVAHLPSGGSIYAVVAGPADPGRSGSPG